MPQPLRLSRTRDVVAHLRADRWRQASGTGPARAQFTHPTKPGLISLDLTEPCIPTATLRSIYLSANWDW